MFESDDYDQILSQIDLPETCNSSREITRDEDTSHNNSKCINENSRSPKNKYLLAKLPEKKCKENIEYNSDIIKPITVVKNQNMVNIQVSPKHTKRKLINSYFDHKSKRKFPGPAGLLNGSLEESKEDDICHVELLSQDVDYSLGHIQKGIFESPLWSRLLQDTKDLSKVDTIRNIKQQALKGNLRRRKADNITAYVESVDRSDIDPLIVLRDTTENIKCTLHRDAWVAFSPYIVSECCALVLHSPTVLTTGSAFKKHYLNITLSNIHALYSTAIINRDDETFPTGFNKIYEEEYTIIKNEKQNAETNCFTEVEDSCNILDGLDGAFSEDIF